ncbi:MAG: DUF2273 domain-containing protein [Actinomycetota bacterium]|nr:DUF2273 domain-containing protein [Actinomycetota bacterium]
MSTIRFSILVGLVIGVVWAAEGITGALVAAVLTAVGGVVGWLVSQGAIDLSAIVGRRDDD